MKTDMLSIRQCRIPSLLPLLDLREPHSTRCRASYSVLPTDAGGVITESVNWIVELPPQYDDRRLGPVVVPDEKGRPPITQATDANRD